MESLINRIRELKQTINLEERYNYSFELNSDINHVVLRWC